MANKPRILLGPKDLIWSLIPLILICVVFAGLASQCSVSPGGPKPGPVPSFDAEAAFRADARTRPFPIRDPQVPAGWQSNSGSHALAADPGGGAITTVGYITAGGAYLAYQQSNASAQALARTLDPDLTATTTQQAAGRTWVVYTAPGRESAWTVDLGDVRILISGAGSHDEYTQLAGAILLAQPLPH